MKAVTSVPGIIGILNELADATMLLDAAVLHLYSNDLTPNQNTAIGEFTEADYTGYATLTLSAWGTAYIGIDGLGHLPHASHEFQPTGTAVGNTIYGYYVTKAAAPTVLLFSRRLDDPTVLNDPTDALVLIPEFDYPQQ